jgi:GTPase SAR1 family protein
MQARFELHEGLDKLTKIISVLPPDSPHWNEAQNRFQFIDRLLVECLGWDQVYMEVENTAEDGGRADYILGKPRRAVLEAKREALEWSLPAGGRFDRPRSLKSAMASCPRFAQVVHQIIPYCSIRGVPVAVVSNGRQLAVFQAITIGDPPLEGQFYAFNGFKDLISGFSLLWELLSPDGIEENRALQKLSQLRSPRMPAKASTSIPEPYKHRYRDEVQQSLQAIGSLLLEEIEDNPKTRKEFYEECYVSLEANNRHLLLSKNIIERRYKRSGDDASSPAPLSAGSVGDLVSSVVSHVGSRPIVVLGDVGVGKSSFFESLQIKTEMKSSSSVYLKVDLGKSANLTSSVKDYVLSALPTILRRDYGIDIYDRDFIYSIYHEEIKRFEKRTEAGLKDIDRSEYEKAKISYITSLTSRADAHLHAVLAHLSQGQKRQITLVIDNADQRTYPIQQEAFLIAQELAATRHVIVFVALRPSTFLASKTSGALSAYQNKVLSISPPPIDEVVIKRIAFALRVAEGAVAPAALEGIRLNLASVVLFLTATLRSIKSNVDIKQFLSNISGGNTRAIIELITGFCGSSNVDCRKIIDIEERYGNYKVPLHEFTKHALLGEYSYYNPNSSQLATNIFDLTTSDPREHFIMPLVVAFLASNHGIKDNDGFFFGEDVRAELSRLGFSDDQISQSLRRSAMGRIIETPHSHFREIPVGEKVSPFSFNFRATSVGLYHVRHWCGSFPFLDAVSTDTPILDDGYRRTVFDLASSLDIRDRYTKAATFRSYLYDCWNNSSFPVSYYDFRAVTEANVKDFEAIERVLARIKH